MCIRDRIERTAPEKLTLRMWAFPYLTWTALAAMLAVLVLMLTDDGARPQLLWSAAATGAVLVIAGLRELRMRRSGR